MRLAGVAGALFLAGWAVATPPAAIMVDYPADGSVFPPEITAPAFLWRDRSDAADVWRVEIAFADGSPQIEAASKGERLRVGPIDPDCIAPTNELPKLTAQQAAARTWTPDAATWAAIKKRSVAGAATVTIVGLRGGEAVSRGQVKIRTSRDPVGAPIFYRDVPLMPSETQTGVIKPLAPYAVRLIEWRVRDVGEPRSRVVLANMPVCVNCHSFSRDGKTIGFVLDGLQNNKGMYALAPLRAETLVGNKDVIQWSSAKGRLQGGLRIGFMSQVSPDGRYVVTTIDTQAPASNYYVANFKDYKFLQVFYPTRGVLSWYSRAAGLLQPLPGADDPRFVQTNAVWSPDGQYLVFARAEAKEPNPEGAPVAQYSNDPNERPMRYDLYRIPFNGGKGGTAEPLEGASRNGMSNSFPKVSPDGRWIVFVQSRNGLLMRPDSQLYIVPAAGGQARLMRCNTPLMNSWHSFSPNGRWMVFSSKSRSPYTQMYLTHIGEDGADSPAILIENSTAANRAVNLPEFVNIGPDGLKKLGGPALDYFKLFDRALYLQKQRRYNESAAVWEKALAIHPDDPLSQNNCGVALMLAGRREEATPHLRKATEIRLRSALAANPASAELEERLGRTLLDGAAVEEAAAHLRRALALRPAFPAARCGLAAALVAQGRLEEAAAEMPKAGDSPACADAHRGLGEALYALGRTVEALAHWREGIRLQPNDVRMVERAAWALATSPEPSQRNGSQAVALALRAVQLSSGGDPAALDALGAAYAETGRFADAAVTARRALLAAEKKKQRALVEAIQGRIALYEAKTPFRLAAHPQPLAAP